MSPPGRVRSWRDAARARAVRRGAGAACGVAGAGVGRGAGVASAGGGSSGTGVVGAFGGAGGSVVVGGGTIGPGISIDAGSVPGGTSTGTISPVGSCTHTTYCCATTGMVNAMNVAATRSPAASSTMRSRVFILAGLRPPSGDLFQHRAGLPSLASACAGCLAFGPARRHAPAGERIALMVSSSASASPTFSAAAGPRELGHAQPDTLLALLLPAERGQKGHVQHVAIAPGGGTPGPVGAQDAIAGVPPLA